MKLALTEVYEVATFYAHFDVVKEGADAPPAVTVRVCDSSRCAMAGAERLLDELAGEARSRRAGAARALHGRVRPRAGLCGRPRPGAAGECGAPDRGAGARDACASLCAGRDLAAYRLEGGYALLGDCLSGKHTVEDIIKAVSDANLRGLGGAGFPTGRKWSLVRAGAGPALDGRQRRRGRARHLQGPPLSRARPAPLRRRAC